MLVQGYVDAVGKVVRVDEEGASWRVWIRPPERFRGQLTAKTPIAVNGVSMTVAEVLKDRFCVVVLPVTRTATTLVHLAQGTRVNLELDLVTRLVTLRGSSASAALTRGPFPGTFPARPRHPAGGAPRAAGRTDRAHRGDGRALRGRRAPAGRRVL
jgi:3,4-dihydroxy 2-butanone 4-phosphate synthase